MLSIIQQTADETTGLTPQDTICTLEETLGSINKLTYRIYPDSRAYGKAQPRVTAVWGIDKQLDEEAFRGRVSRIEGKSSGTTAQNVTCESAAARLKDGIVSVSVSRTEILQTALMRILQAHREITDEDSHVYLGNCPETIVQETQDFDFTTTLEAIETVCADAGLEWRVRYDDASGHYLLDVSELFGTLSETVISVGKNLGSIRYTVDPSQLATRLIPLGGIGYNGQRLTIRTVGGHDSIFIDRPDLIAKYGVICRKIVYDDIAVDDPQYFGERAAELYRRGVEDSNGLTEPAVTWEVSAIELARAGYAPDIFRVGNFYRIIHPMLGADVTLRLVGKKTDYRNPQRSSLTFGDRAATLTSSLAGAVTQVTARQTAQNINITQIIQAATGGQHIAAMTETEYNALETKSANTLYIAYTNVDFTLFYGALPLRAGGAEMAYILDDVVFYTTHDIGSMEPCYKFKPSRTLHFEQGGTIETCFTVPELTASSDVAFIHEATEGGNDPFEVWQLCINHTDINDMYLTIRCRLALFNTKERFYYKVESGKTYTVTYYMPVDDYYVNTLHIVIYNHTDKTETTFDLTSENMAMNYFVPNAGLFYAVGCNYNGNYPLHGINSVRVYDTYLTTQQIQHNRQLDSKFVQSEG